MAQRRRLCSWRWRLGERGGRRRGIVPGQCLVLERPPRCSGPLKKRKQQARERKTTPGQRLRVAKKRRRGFIDLVFFERRPMVQGCGAGRPRRRQRRRQSGLRPWRMDVCGQRGERRHPVLLEGTAGTGSRSLPLINSPRTLRVREKRFLPSTQNCTQERAEDDDNDQFEAYPSRLRLCLNVYLV